MTTKRKQPKAVKQWALVDERGRYVRRPSGTVELHLTSLDAECFAHADHTAIRVLITPVIGRK